MVNGLTRVDLAVNSGSAHNMQRHTKSTREYGGHGGGATLDRKQFHKHTNTSKKNLTKRAFSTDLMTNARKGLTTSPKLASGFSSLTRERLP